MEVQKLLTFCYVSLIIVSGEYYLIICAETSGNVTKDMCAQRRFRSACVFAQADQNLHWVHLG